MLKKSGTELAWRAMKPNNRLRHRIMGAGPVGMSRMRPRYYVVSSVGASRPSRWQRAMISWTLGRSMNP